ncbi:MAG: hypothetical protein LBM09_02925 [Candidatus Nomurabacteria bacterium]|jgi:hypothetical protein|nr:hypothetical protein [Candidatus Nomurabacteria bacterium]
MEKPSYQSNQLVTNELEQNTVEPNSEFEQNPAKTASDYLMETGLNNPETVEDLIQNGTYKDFKVHLVRLNALFRNISPEQHEIDGGAVYVGDNLLPISTEHKEEVVEMAFDALKDLSPKDRGVLTYNILGAVHLFGDGNGRSMRVWHHILSGERIDEEAIKVLTEHDNDTQNGTATTGRKEIQSYLNANTYATSGFANFVAFDSELERLGANNIRSALPWVEPQFDDETIKSLSVKDIDRIKSICANDTGSFICPFNIMTIHMLSKEDETFKIPPAEIENGTYMYDNEQNGAITLNHEQAKRFIEINDQLKMASFGAMIDIFKNPTAHTYENGTPLKNGFYAQNK